MSAKIYRLTDYGEIAVYGDLDSIWHASRIIPYANDGFMVEIQSANSNGIYLN